MEGTIFLELDVIEKRLFEINENLKRIADSLETNLDKANGIAEKAFDAMFGNPQVLLDSLTIIGGDFDV